MLYEFMFSLLCWKFIFRIPGLEWSCNTGEGLAMTLVLQDYRIPVCAQLLVMIVIAGWLSLWIYVFKTSLLASRRQQTSTDLQSKNTLG